MHSLFDRVLRELFEQQGFSPTPRVSDLTCATAMRMAHLVMCVTGSHGIVTHTHDLFLSLYICIELMGRRGCLGERGGCVWLSVDPTRQKHIAYCYMLLAMPPIMRSGCDKAKTCA